MSYGNGMGPQADRSREPGHRCPRRRTTGGMAITFTFRTTNTKIKPGQQATIKTSQPTEQLVRKLNVRREVAECFALLSLNVAGKDILNFKDGQPLLNYMNCGTGWWHVEKGVEVSITVRNISKTPQHFEALLTNGDVPISPSPRTKVAQP